MNKKIKWGILVIIGIGLAGLGIRTFIPRENKELAEAPQTKSGTSAVSTVSLGELFTRMDGLSYFVYFAAQTVQTAVCVSLIRELLSRIGERKPRKTAAFFLAISLLVGCILG